MSTYCKCYSKNQYNSYNDPHLYGIIMLSSACSHSYIGYETYVTGYEPRHEQKQQFGFPDKDRHKPASKVTEAGLRLEILN